jgi:cytosine deaminase
MRITDARLPTGALADITIAAGRIAAIDPPSGALADHDARGRLILPALTDGHVHLDKTLWGMPWRPNESGASVRSRIEAERRIRPTLATPVQSRAQALLNAMAAHGTVALRTHADIDDTTGLGNLHAVLEVAQANRHRLDIQIVAFPQSGITTRPGVAELLDQALAQGADLIGGLDPQSIDGDADAHLDVVFRLATRHAKGIDIHLHDAGPSGNEQLRAIARRTVETGLSGKVTVSHAFSLGTPDARDFARTADALAAAGVAILTSAPGAAPMPPVLALRQHGVTIFAGNDNIRDLWSPHGTGDMLERVWLVA